MSTESAAPELCNHPQCVICLRRTCWSDEDINGIRLEKFGELLACPRCVRKAVNWAFQSAMHWGGAYKDVCGKVRVKRDEH